MATLQFSQWVPTLPTFEVPCSNRSFSNLGMDSFEAFLPSDALPECDICRRVVSDVCHVRVVCCGHSCYRMQIGNRIRAE